MPLESGKVRLPGLPIFRKFSLALREEFGSPDEVLKALEESRRQVKALIDESRPGTLRPGRAGDRPAKGSMPPDMGKEEDSPESFVKDSVGSARTARPARRQSSARAVAKKVSVPDLPRAEPEPASASPPAAKSMPAQKTQSPEGDDEADFWGERRGWGKQEKPRRKDKPGKPAPGRPAVIRVSAEGKPVKEDEDGPDDGG